MSAQSSTSSATFNTPAVAALHKDTDSNQVMAALGGICQLEKSGFPGLVSGLMRVSEAYDFHQRSLDIVSASAGSGKMGSSGVTYQFQKVAPYADAVLAIIDTHAFKNERETGTASAVLQPIGDSKAVVTIAGPAQANDPVVAPAWANISISTVTSSDTGLAADRALASFPYVLGDRLYITGTGLGAQPVHGAGDPAPIHKVRITTAGKDDVYEYVRTEGGNMGVYARTIASGAAPTAQSQMQILAGPNWVAWTMAQDRDSWVELEFAQDAVYSQLGYNLVGAPAVTVAAAILEGSDLAVLVAGDAATWALNTDFTVTQTIAPPQAADSTYFRDLAPYFAFNALTVSCGTAKLLDLNSSQDVPMTLILNSLLTRPKYAKSIWDKINGSAHSIAELKKYTHSFRIVEGSKTLRNQHQFVIPLIQFGQAIPMRLAEQTAWSLTAHFNPFTNLIYAPNGAHLKVASADGKVSTVDLNNTHAEIRASMSWVTSSDREIQLFQNLYTQAIDCFDGLRGQRGHMLIRRNIVFAASEAAVVTSATTDKLVTMKLTPSRPVIGWIVGYGPEVPAKDKLVGPANQGEGYDEPYSHYSVKIGHSHILQNITQALSYVLTQENFENFLGFQMLEERGFLFIPSSCQPTFHATQRTPGATNRQSCEQTIEYTLAAGTPTGGTLSVFAVVDDIFKGDRLAITSVFTVTPGSI
jgi:hypothetical protein